LNILKEIARMQSIVASRSGNYHWNH